jgi:hypothetical protein
MTAETESIQRVRYEERELLKAADLADEQSSRLTIRWLHQIVEHEFGIVFGLAVIVDDLWLTIQPGVAVDGFGRELVLSGPLSMTWGHWSDAGEPGRGDRNLFDLLAESLDENGNRSADLWLLWDRHLDPTSHQRARWLETPRLRVLPVPHRDQTVSSSNVDPRIPTGEDTDPISATLAGQADDLEREWPVFLGRVTQHVEAGTNVAGYAVESAPVRPYARLRGETITAASRLAQIHLAGGPGPSRFAVSIHDPAAAAGKVDAEPLAINEPGDLVTHGDTYIFGVTSQAGRRRGNIVLENRPPVGSGDLRSLRYMAERLADQSDPAAKVIFEKLSEKSKEYLNTLNQGNLSNIKGIRRILASELSGMLQEGLPAVILRDLPVTRIPGLPIGGRLPFFPHGPIFRRESPLVRRRLQGLNRRMARSGARAIDEGQENLSVEETQALLDGLFPGLFNGSADQLGQDWGLEVRPLPQPPAEAAPWQVYHAVVKQQDGQEIHQLRVEIENPAEKGDPRLYRFVVGTREDTGAFEECFIVQADGTVIMLGQNIHVTGRVMEGPVQADPQDPRLAGALIEGATLGVPSSTSLTARIVVEDKKLKGYSITNNTNRQFTCNPLYESIRNAKTQAIVREGSIGSTSFTVPVGSPYKVDADLTGLSGDLIVRISVIGADTNGNYAKAGDEATVKL